MAEYKSFEEFRKVIKARSYGPVVLFHGPEDFFMEEGIDAIVDQTLDKAARSFNLDTLWGAKADVRDILAVASSFPMMSEKRVLIVREFDRLAAKESAAAPLCAYLANPLPSTVLLCTAEKRDGRRKAYKDLSAHGDSVECKAMYADRLPDWLVERFKLAKRSIDPEACQLLVAHVGTSLRALQNEIDKVLIAVGDRSAIGVEDIAAVVGASRGYTVFDLQNAIGRRDLAGALPILRRMIELGESHIAIITMLTRYFTGLMVTQDMLGRHDPPAAIAAAIHVSPFFVKDYVAASAKFTPAEIDRAFGALLHADVQFKSSTIDIEVGLELLLYALLHGSPELARL